MSTYMDAFGEVVAGGFDHLLPYLESMAQTAMVLGACWISFSAMFRQWGMLSSAMKFVFLASFYLFVIQNVLPISEEFMTGAVDFGLVAGGSSANADEFLRSPDLIFSMGHARAIELFELANTACDASMWGCLGRISSWFPVYATAWVVYLTFALIGMAVMLTSILFKLACLAGGVLLPLAIWPPTAQFGFKPISSVIHFGVQLMVLSLVTSVNSLVFGVLGIGIDPGVDAVTPLLLGALIFAGTTLGASRLAYSLVSGATLAAGSVLAGPSGALAAGGRSAAGHLDGPASATAKLAAASTVRGASALAAAGRRNASLAREFYRR